MTIKFEVDREICYSCIVIPIDEHSSAVLRYRFKNILLLCSDTDWLIIYCCIVIPIGEYITAE